MSKLLTKAKSQILLLSAVSALYTSCNNPFQNKPPQQDSTKQQNTSQQNNVDSNKAASAMTTSELNNALKKSEYNDGILTNLIDSGVTIRGNKQEIFGYIINKASVANYKDVVCEILLYSPTKTLVDTKSITIYKFFPPRDTVYFSIPITLSDIIDFQHGFTFNFKITNATPVDADFAPKDTAKKM